MCIVIAPDECPVCGSKRLFLKKHDPPPGFTLPADDSGEIGEFIQFACAKPG